MGGDIDDEGWPHVGVEGGVEDLVRPVRSVVAARYLELAEAGDKAGLIAERGTGVVVRVPALPVGKDDDSGP